jgi:hypothetical protein
MIVHCAMQRGRLQMSLADRIVMKRVPIERTDMKTMKTFEIYFQDLNIDAQKRYLEFYGVKSISELNQDCIPIATIDSEE